MVQSSLLVHIRLCQHCCLASFNVSGIDIILMRIMNISWVNSHCDPPVTDDLMADFYGKLSEGAECEVRLKGRLDWEDCSDVQLFVRILSECQVIDK